MAEPTLFFLTGFSAFAIIRLKIWLETSLCFLNPFSGGRTQLEEGKEPYFFKGIGFFIENLAESPQGEL